MSADLRLWHGGVPGLRSGDLLTGGQERRTHDGCPMCAARTNGTATIDAKSARPDRVYLTTVREYARFYASLYGRGDLYRVEALDSGDLEPSTEDHFPTWTAPVVPRAGHLRPCRAARPEPAAPPFPRLD